MASEKLLDVIRLALLECHIEHEDVERIAKHLVRRICEAVQNIEEAQARLYWEGLKRWEIKGERFALMKDN